MTRALLVLLALLFALPAAADIVLHDDLVLVGAPGIPGGAVPRLVTLRSKSGSTFNSTTVIAITGGSGMVYSFSSTEVRAMVLYAGSSSTTRISLHTSHPNPDRITSEGDFTVIKPGGPAATVTLAEPLADFEEVTTASSLPLVATIAPDSFSDVTVGIIPGGEAVPATVTVDPSAGTVTVTATLTFPVGTTTFFLSAQDPAFPFSPGVFVLITITRLGTAGGLDLSVDYLAGFEREVFINPARPAGGASCGGQPGASTGCGSCPGCCADLRVMSDAVSIRDAGPGTVNVALGRVFYSIKALALPGRGIPLELRLIYNSALDLGPGGYVLGAAPWLHCWIRALVPGPGGSLVRIGGDMGRTDLFTPRADGTWQSTGWPAMIRREPEGSYTLRRGDGYKEVYHPIDAGDPLSGRLVRMKDPSLVENVVEVIYETPAGKPRVKHVLDTYGRTALVFAYESSSGLLESVTDLTGREVRFAYNPDGLLQSIRSPVGPVFTTGRVHQFFYVASTRLLSGVRRPNEVFHGVAENAHEFTYGADLKVLTQKWGGTNLSGTAAGGTIHYEYHPGMTRCTDRAGNICDYFLTADGRVERRVEHTRGMRTGGPFVTEYLYNVEGYPSTVFFPEGNSLETDYALSPRFALRNLLAVVLRAGPRGGDQTVITQRYEYEPVFNKPSKIIGPRETDPAFIPPFGSAPKTGRYTEERFYEYQESQGTGDAGLPAPERGWGITGALLGLPDLNGNGGIANCHVLARRVLPAATLPGGARQARIHTYTHNRFAQVVSETDAGGVVTLRTYTPEADPAETGHVEPGRATDTGGFLKTVTTDAEPGSIYAPFHEPITVRHTWDRKGDSLSFLDGRGILTTFEPNEIHLVTRIVRAADTSLQPTRPHEPEAVPALSIETRIHHDANDNVILEEQDNRDNNTTHSGAYLETRTKLDILDNPIRRETEVTATTFILETMGYDRNENEVARKKLHATDFASVVRVFDSRDLLFTESSGEGAEAATRTFHVNRNGFSTGSTDAADNAPGLDLPADGVPETEVVERDGFDREKARIDRLGNRQEVRYDPASNAIEQKFFGHPANDPTGAKVLMQHSLTLFDESSRAVFAKQRLFIDAGQSLSGSPATDTDDPSDASFVTVTRTHDPNDLPVSTSIPNRELGAQVSTTAFDGHRRARLQTDALANTVAVTFNNNHQEIDRTETDLAPSGLAATETFRYLTFVDAIGRTLRTVDPLGHTRRMTYGTQFLTATTDAEGLPSSGGNDPGNRTEYLRDGTGRVVREDRLLTVTGKGGAPLDTSNPGNPDGLLSVFRTYLDDSRTLIETDDRGNPTRTIRDTRNNVVRVEWADGTLTRTVFNLDDDPISVTDQNGSVISQHHDPLGRLFLRTIVRAPGVIGTVRQELAHDGRSRVTLTRDVSPDFTSVLRCAYDSFGNRIEESHNGRLVACAFKSQADPAACTYPDGTVIAYATDKLDRLTRVDESGGLVAALDYIGAWRLLERRYGNGTTTRLHEGGSSTYDADRRPVALGHFKASKLVSGFTAGYNREDYLLHQTRTHLGGSGEQVALDSAYRVTSYRDGVASPAGSPGPGARIEESITLDGVGNWNAQTSRLDLGATSSISTSLNEMNEYTSFGGASQTHDKNGNRDSDSRFTLRWDFANRLREVRTLDGRLVAAYDNHVDGRRVRKVVPGPGRSPARETRFAWCGYRMIEESASGRATARTIWGRGFEQLKRTDLARGGSSIFYHADIKGWIETVTRGQGQVGERYGYSAYGKPRFFEKDGVERDRQTVENPWLYHGYFQDAETGLYYTVHRYHDPETGRWVSRDPSGYHDGMGLYEFVGSRPFATVDPIGEDALPPAPLVKAGANAGAKVLGGAAGATAGATAGAAVGAAVGAYVIGQTTKASWEMGKALGRALRGAMAARRAYQAYKVATTNWGSWPEKKDSKKPAKPCTKAQRDFLQRDVNRYCKRKRKCIPGQSPHELRANLLWNLHCHAARDTLNKECFAGGDLGHREAARDAYKSAMRCVELLGRP